MYALAAEFYKYILYISEEMEDDVGDRWHRRHSFHGQNVGRFQVSFTKFLHYGTQ
jgi:hypothetical protein